MGEGRPIIPGMVATVDILSGKKTVLTYLLKPVLRAKDYALTEPAGERRECHFRLWSGFCPVALPVVQNLLQHVIDGGAEPRNATCPQPPNLACGTARTHPQAHKKTRIDQPIRKSVEAMTESGRDLPGPRDLTITIVEHVRQCEHEGTEAVAEVATLCKLPRGRETQRERQDRV